MDGGRIDRDSDLGEDSPMSHMDEHSDREDDLRDCDSSDEGVNVNHQNNTLMSGMDFGRSPEHNSDSHINQSHLGTNHPLGVLSSSLSALGVHNLQNLHHGDVLERLKMQVRDMKVGLMDQEFAMHPTFGGTMQAHSPYSAAQNLTSQSTTPNGYPFTPPNAPSHKDGNPGSNSSTSSETSNSSQQNNGWSFEEQFKQVRQLYEINDDPKRKEFLDELFQFMQKRGTPINRLPIMAKSVLDLYELYNLVIARGGLVDVINKKLWQEIIKGLHLPSSITSAAFTLRTQYMKYLYPYECEKKNLSTPGELQAAIDGNRREGRRSSYGQFDQQMQTQLQMSHVQRSPVPPSLSQMSPLSLVTSQGHHRMMGAPPVGQMPNLVPHEIEQRMLEYIKLFQTPKEPKRNGSQSPEITPRDALSALEMSRVALWNMYNNNTSPPNPMHQTSPADMQREALNLAESPPHHLPAIKRERETPADYRDERDKDFSMPPAKRGLTITPTPHSLLNTSLDSSDSSFVSTKENGSSRKGHHTLNNNVQHSKHHSATSLHQSSPHHRREERRLQQEMEQKLTHSLKNGTEKVVHRDEKPPASAVESSASGGGGGTTVLNGMQFKIISRGNAETGDQQLVVTMEFNGTQYEGVLFANPMSTTPVDLNSPAKQLLQPVSTKNTNNNNSMEDRQQQSQQQQHIQRPLISS